MGTSIRVVLDLDITVSHARLDEFMAFLRRAIPVYEQPGGIRVTLLCDDQRVDRYIERIEYVDRAAFDLDQRRVGEDPQMKALLAEWRCLLEAPPTVRVYREVRLI